MMKSISEAMIQAVKKFKTSLKMRNLNIEFGQKAFIKGFELCEISHQRRSTTLGHSDKALDKEPKEESLSSEKEVEEDGG
ncbi:hypothetical protein COCNU_scaffold007075G000010 [Cocos nucifera]|nr:hypothetical protein [Cocos nucifera]